ncbi:hypothetical protein BV25DRAFT_1816482 [Artomyces pyxidatus]|uniref:Uncharacterized protein n=1 Tax=Artomyces pyxidatus TaxID=48021 RepID=A0ACB8SFL4_9AGAM|nr:hypothetical protein BV25DRAFT_1816482 [Artomyces pyxidatus]
MSACNLHFTAFQKVVGVWLFAHTASDGIYAILSRLGLSVSYTTVLKLLRALSNSAVGIVREIADLRAFLLIYDNINRMSRAWDADLGQRNIIHNGTAATFIELDLGGRDVKIVFDPAPLRKAQEDERRRSLNLNLLYNRIPWGRINTVCALHCLRYLVDEVPVLHTHHDFIHLRFRTTLAVHRMKPGRKTALHPLATSDHDEGNTAENARVLDDLLIRQLRMPKEEVNKLLVIVGGDQSTVEKLRTLKKFLASCPHGYKQYGWVLPLIQLWHMGWADLERVLSTHWGNSHETDLSSFQTTNNIMGRNVKNVKRPDYYPAQRLVLDTLRVDILDCWRSNLGVSDLDAYFRATPMEIEDLLELAEKFRLKYLTMIAHEDASHPKAGSQMNTSARFKTGKPWTSAKTAPLASEAAKVTDKPTVPFIGDRVLANSILRMRDSMLHMEFQYAIADGDIGRAMDIMSVWTFTFTGCGKNKYANEMLELTCNFEFEYSKDLQNVIKDNWLVNLTGIDGCWFPMDLLQEKNIKQLKKMSTRRDAEFGGEFFQKVIAVNIRAFLEAITSMKTAVGLGAKGGSHRRKAKEASARELTRHIEEQGLHEFRTGRTGGHIAQDDFAVGYDRLLTSKKLQDFVDRTVRDAGAIHADEDEDDDKQHGTGDAHGSNGVDGPEGRISELPMPNMVVNGRLEDGKFFDEEDSEDEDEVDDEVDDDVAMDEGL